MGVAKVTRNYQVTIPKDIRRIHDIKIGDEVFFAVEGDRVDFFKMERKDAINMVAGRWKDLKTSGIEYVKNMRKEWKGRGGRMRK